MVLCSDSPPTPWNSHVMDRIAGGLGVGGWSIDITTEQEQGDTTTEGKHNKEVAISGSQFLNCEAKISLFEDP